MTDRFFDTAALIKCYTEEPTTKTVDELIEETNTTAFGTSLSVVETTSAFRRQYDRGDVTEEAILDLMNAFSDEALAEFTSLPK